LRSAQTQTVKEDSFAQASEPEQTAKIETEQTPVKTDITPLTDEQKSNINKYSSFAQTKKQQKKYREMIEYINQIIAIDPDFSHAKNILLLWRGNGYDELGIKDSAKVDYERFSELKPDNSQCLVLLDYIYVTEGKIDKAIEIAKKMIELDKEDKTLLKKLGKYYYQQAEVLKAENPDDPEIEDYAVQAIDQFEEYLENFPEDEEINNLHTFLISKFLDQKALRSKLEENLVKDPDNPKTIERLASIYADEGNSAKATELFEKLLQFQPDNLKAIKKLIRINKNNIDKSIFYNQKAMKLDGANETYNINLAKLYSEKKRFVDARNECLKALSKNSRNTNIYKAWAGIYTDCVGTCNTSVEYQDKLVFVIAYGLYEKAGDTRRMHSMKESLQVPAKSDLFTNKKTTFPTRDCYKWIDKEWDEAKYIETFLKAL